MIRAAMLLTAVSLFACNGCNGDGNAPPANTGPAGPSGVPSGTMPPAAGGETVIHVEDDGHTFDVARGSAVTFKLASNAGTGFQWSPAPGTDPNILAQQGDRGQELSSDTPGAPKMDVFHFMANAPGTAAVEMDLKRPWGNQPPGRVIHVTVNVH
jgi:predicted secreted protein